MAGSIDWQRTAVASDMFCDIERLRFSIQAKGDGGRCQRHLLGSSPSILRTV